MTPAPRRDSRAGAVYNDLRNLARSAGRDPAEYLALYTLEGFLVRLTASDRTGDLVLKGGVLLDAFAARRPTRDIDIAASGLPNDVGEVERRIAAIVAIDLDDGLQFEHGSIRGEIIRDEADYTGVRVHATASLATARIPFHVDVNFGDTIWPAPQTVALPRLLGGEIRVQGYPAHMVLAEKLVTAVDRGQANTRWRDFVDVVMITGTTSVSAHDLVSALRAVSEHRQVELRPLAGVLDGMAAIAQTRWAAWRRKQRLTDSTPQSFAELLENVIEFVDPVIEGTVPNATWDHAIGRWQ